MNNRGILIVLSGFSGAGKGTVVKNILKTYPDEYAVSVSATTRAPRDVKPTAGNIFSNPLPNSRR